MAIFLMQNWRLFHHHRTETMKPTILGISCFFHDAAACLIKDGKIIAAVAEERLNRLKHFSGFPELAIDYVLRAGRINPEAIEAVAFYDKPFIKFDRLLTSIIATWPRSRALFTHAIPEWAAHKLRVEDKIENMLGRLPPIYYLEHHLSHAASAFYHSGFKEAAILTLDGVGEWTTGTLGYAKGRQITLPLEIRFPHSLGLLYSAITTYLGFAANDAEWKVMGLAPYGEPRLVNKFYKLIDIYDDGSFRLDMDYFSYHFSRETMFNERLVNLLGEPPRQPESAITSFHQDVAASLQVIVQEIIKRLLKTVYNRFPSQNICLAGGIILNSLANGRLLPRGPFKSWYIPSAPGDDGGAIGAALALYHEIYNQPRLPQLDASFFGPEFRLEAIRGYLKSRKLSFKELTDDKIITYLAEALKRNKIVGLFRGQMEFGPRALGNRSILANPTSPKMKDYINQKIKYRESFRPLAPAVIAEAAPKYFELGAPSPFMSSVFKVKKAYQNKLPAITHVDGSARLQTVSVGQNKFLYQLLKKFGELSGYPVLVNTSFNRRGEPIVCTPHDAVECFLNTSLDILVLNSCLLIKDNVNHA